MTEFYIMGIMVCTCPMVENATSSLINLYEGKD